MEHNSHYIFIFLLSGSPKQPEIRQIGRAVEDEPLTLTCTTSSTSLPPDPNVTFTFKWFVNDTLMEDLSDGSVTFYVLRSNTGNYSCLAMENSERGMTSSPSEDLYVDVFCELFPSRVSLLCCLDKMSAFCKHLKLEHLSEHRTFV